MTKKRRSFKQVLKDALDASTEVMAVETKLNVAMKRARAERAAAEAAAAKAQEGK